MQPHPFKSFGVTDFTNEQINVRPWFWRTWGPKKSCMLAKWKAANARLAKTQLLPLADSLKCSSSFTPLSLVLLDPPFDVTLDADGQVGQLKVFWRAIIPQYYESNSLYKIRYSSGGSERIKEVHAARTALKTSSSTLCVTIKAFLYTMWFK